MGFRPSSRLFRSGGQVRFAQGRTNRETRERTYSLVSAELTPYLEATLERAGAGRTPGELAEALVDAETGVTLDDATGYIDDLIEAQILVSPLAPTITGVEAIDDVVLTLRAARADGAADTLARVAGELEAMDRAGLGLSPARYTAVAAMLPALPAKTELRRLFQVDLFKPAPGSAFGGAPLRELQRVLGVLARFRPSAPRDDGLRRFREALPNATKRPRFASSMPSTRSGESASTARWQGRNRRLSWSTFRSPGRSRSLPHSGHTRLGSRPGWSRLRAAPSAFGHSTGRTWRSSRPTRPPACPTPSASSQLSRRRLPTSGRFTLLFRGVSGPSGAVLLGRLCHGDEALARSVRAHLRAEEALRPDAIFAEIIHHSEGRLGNILCRRVLRAYEIPYSGRLRALPRRARRPLGRYWLDRSPRAPTGSLRRSTPGRRRRTASSRT